MTCFALRVGCALTPAIALALYASVVPNSLPVSSMQQQPFSQGHLSGFAHTTKTGSTLVLM